MDSSPQPEYSAIHDFTQGWRIVAITLLTALPWTIVAVFDAIDDKYRTRFATALRLFASSLCLVLAYTCGLLFSVLLTIQMLNEPRGDRYDEIATILVLLVFNLWHVSRNCRGWLQYAAIHNIKPMFCTVQTSFAKSFPSDVSTGHCIQGLEQVRISNLLIDNEWNGRSPFLSPFFRIHASSGDTAAEAWATAMWRAWWTQDTMVSGPINVLDISVPDHFLCDATHRFPNVERLMETNPCWPERDVIDERTNSIIKNKKHWAEALCEYGTSEGQQDTHGEGIPNVITTGDASGIAILVHEKISRLPNRFCALWYNTSRFEEVYGGKIDDLRRDSKVAHILFPQWSNWLKTAQDIASNLPRPMFLSDTQLVNYAGELASSSVILVAYGGKYRELVEQIYQDGLNARWTFGWSGLLACFSQLWTKERIYIAMLNGLSLLALVSADRVSDITENVRSMLYGYAAFEVSDRAVGKRIAEDRKAELLRRYTLNKGKTCRGSGVCAIRMACKTLGIPAEASHMDGLPAFCIGWCSEYMERKPGNQTPEHGADHDEVERLMGSSSAWRYPHSFY